MSYSTKYDVAITGGGLAGLCLSIALSKKGHRVILLEKEVYPFHRVCGEYISMESWDYLKRLGVPLDKMDLPRIRKLQITSIGGDALLQQLPLGGFGISRYLLDSTLADIAVRNNVILKTNIKVDDIKFDSGNFITEAPGLRIQSRIAVASFGKRSNIDVKWSRSFVKSPRTRLNNHVGIKYHMKASFPEDMIALHTFKNGYAGIVMVEEGIVNFCYLTTASNLKSSKGSVSKMEKEILSENSHLKAFFEKSEKSWSEPLTISQISFDKKTLFEDHVLMLGDAAGMITPLCGNGMSMAIHGSKIAADHIHRYLSGEINLQMMEEGYKKDWNNNFGKRLKMGRRIKK